MKEINEIPLIPSVYSTGEKLKISENLLQRRRMHKRRNPPEKKEPEDVEPIREKEDRGKKLEITV